ncbi:unnamed protein product [Brachionus calyciflorus]|uniref:PSP proline-rich domain-containing protein n=1 Tax=Brachionus calyciflorus TaxID=104777 RepID=A0A813V4T3_9BILA|nr:unnamed protein product [Brachionus calyciflorus]
MTTIETNSQEEIDLNSELPFTKADETQVLTPVTDVIDSSDDENFEFGNEEFCLIKLSSYSLNEFRLIKNAIEDALIRKCKKLDYPDKTKEERFVCYYKNYALDRVGKAVTQGETGIAEGWNIPIYENEFQNLLGLPFHEDNALAETLRIKRPRLECFNCLATNHRVTECPVKIDDERIRIHRKIFASQSVAANEQAELFSTRYTSDSKDNRGFTPGKVSSELRQALGIKDNQLPPYIYLMRELGYPIGWLLEAQCKKSDLELFHDDKNGKKTPEKEIIEFDADKIISFPGFNEPPAHGILDESQNYNVERYNSRLSKENFLKTLNLRKKRAFRRTSLAKTALEEGSDGEQEMEEMEKSTESIEDGMILDETEGQSPKKRAKIEPRGSAVIAIPGTPIIESATGVKQVPNWEKFSENICEHKPFDMDVSVPQGSYQNIVKLTRDYKAKTTDSSSQ